MKKRIALAALSSAVCLVLLEIAVRVALPRPAFIAFPIAEVRGIMQPDPVRSYTYAPNLKRHIVTPDYEIDFATNLLGMRDVEPDQVPAGSRILLAVGDSYTQGHGVELAESWPKQVQSRLPGTHVFNAGVSAYGLREIRKAAAQLIPVVEPKALLVGVFVNGFARIGDPYVILGDRAGVVQTSMASRVIADDDGYLLPTFNDRRLQSVAFVIDRYWRFGSHLMHLVFDHYEPSPAPVLKRDEARDELEPMLEELDGLARDLVQDGIPMVALLINSASEPDGSIAPDRLLRNEIVAEFAREHRICLVDPFPALLRSNLKTELRLGSDAHWSRQAHRIAASEIVATLSASQGTDSPCASAVGALFP